MTQAGRVQPRCGRSSDAGPVVVGVDGSEAALGAVRWAAGHAGDTGARLRLVHVVTPTDGVGVTGPGSSDHSADPYRPGSPAERVLDVAAAEASRVGRRQVETSVSAAPDAVTALVDASSEAGLLVLGPQLRGRWATLFSSVATRVVAAAPCPVVVVRGDDEPAGPVVVAVDVSEHCEAALRFAFLEAARRRCPLVAVHAWQPPLAAAGVRIRAGVAAAVQLADEDVVVAAWRSLVDTVDQWRVAFPDVVVRERLVQGDPETVMAEEASGAALVVVGSRGRGPVAGLLLGSTSQSLVHTAGCPVAVVRSRDDEGPDISPA